MNGLHYVTATPVCSNTKYQSPIPHIVPVKYSLPCLNWRVLHWATSYGRSCSNIVQNIWLPSESNMSVYMVWMCGCEVHSLWRSTAWIVFVKDSWNGRKLPSWGLRCNKVKLTVNARSQLIISNTWQSLSLSVPILTVMVTPNIK